MWSDTYSVDALHSTRSPPPPRYTLGKYEYIPLYLFTQGGGGDEPVRRLEGP
jgi:hypothetical protein